ncbi:hypothetical protein MBLNU230_g3574t1 [Neophaeotheca triangularis]
MANKRKAREAFGQPQGQVSAFAAAKARAVQKTGPNINENLENVKTASNGFSEALAASVGAHPYDGHESDVSSTGTILSEDEGSSAPTPLPTTARALSTLHLDPDRISKDDASTLEFTLKPGETASFAGIYDLSVIRGCARVYGATLRPNSNKQRVYALIAHAIPQITSHQGEATIALRHVGESFGKLERLSPLFKNLLPEDAVQGRSFDLVQGPASLTPLDIGRETRSVLSTIVAEAEQNEANVKVMTIGAKSSGKSTFNRLCCNALVARPDKKCYYLDLDLGQPEFGPPGQISLIEVHGLVAGPAYTHIAAKSLKDYKLLRSHTLAATTFKDDPDHYLACARDLANRYQLQVRASRAPLIVNTCGWVAGVGAQVLSEVCKTIRPSHIISLGGLEDAVHQNIRSITNAETHVLPRQPARPPIRSPAELRAMQTMSYFHQRVTPTKFGATNDWTSRPINTHKPWHVSYGGSNSGIHAITSYNQTIPPDFLAEILDGSIVAIVTTNPGNLPQALNQPYPQSDSADEDSTNEPLIHRTPHENLPYLPPTHQGLSNSLNPSYTTFASLALVRAIDTETQTLQLLTPLPEAEIAELMRQKIVLVRGAFDAPEWAYLEGLNAAESAEANGITDIREEGLRPPWVGVKSGERRKGIEGAVWRLRHPPMAGGGK